MIRQATCETDGWDVSITSEIQRDYQRWLADLESAKQFLDISEVQLQVFADAFELAFSAVVYACFIGDSESLLTALIMFKSRITPRRKLTIPRLELQATVLAVRLSQTAAQIMGVDSSRVTYWTDWLTVLNWLKMDSQRLKSFVAHRVAEITTDSELRQWRHVPGRLPEELRPTLPTSAYADSAEPEVKAE
ncbi:hypothetical protein D918_04851 [Trichuris suis]|nr:hypothetical protein D918_04851 [Trichuris suis]